jgi:hypothetical protein
MIALLAQQQMYAALAQIAQSFGKSRMLESGGRQSPG